MTVVRRVAALRPESARLARTVGVLSRYGLGARVGERAPAWVRRHVTEPDGRLVRDCPEPERLRLALEELGPIYVKLGQLLSVSGAVPAAAAEALAQLQEHAAARPVEEVRATIAGELGRPVGQLFAAFDDAPLGVASIGQVHAARLPDGTDVVVKVQHEGIEAIVHEDLEIIAGLAGVVEDHVAGARPFRPRELAARFRARTLAELDFTAEADNLERFRERFAADADVHFPRPYRELTTRRVLALELLHGSALADLAAGDAAIDRVAFARRCAGVWMDMIFRDGFVHADPHPGNIFVLPGGRLGIVDCGMVMRVDADTRAALGAIAAALAAGSSEALATTLLEVCDHPDDLDRAAFAEDVAALMDRRLASGGALDLGAALHDVRHAVRAHRLEIPGRVDLLAQVGAELEGTVRELDDGFELVPVLRATVRRLAEARLRPEALLQRGEEALRHLALERHGAGGLLHRLRSGSFEVVVRHTDADEAIDRLTYGLLTAAALVGAPIVWHADPPPHRGGVSVVGATLTGASVVMGAGLLRRLRRDARRRIPARTAG